MFATSMSSTTYAFKKRNSYCTSLTLTIPPLQWLESFVNNGTSQIQGISANVDRLCTELGLSEDLSSNVPDHHPQKAGLAPSRPNLVKDIQQLMLGIQARDQNFVALQGAVHSLLEVLTVSQTQQGAGMCSFRVCYMRY